jgi:hypothetical protein
MNVAHRVTCDRSSGGWAETDRLPRRRATCHPSGPHHRRVRTALPFLIAVTTVCGAESTASGSGHSVVDSAGIQIVTSQDPAWPDGYRRVEPEPLLRIGRDEEGPYQFGRLGRALLEDDGSIVVIEQMSDEIRIFDSDGTHLVSLGGTGEGPGEFVEPWGPFRYPRDSIAVTDRQIRRITIFSTTTGEDRTLMAENPGMLAMGVLRDGTFLYRLFGSRARYLADASPGRQWLLDEIFSLDPSDGSMQAIARLPDRDLIVKPGGSTTERRIFAGGPNSNTKHLSPPSQYRAAVAEDGFYWVAPETYEIQFYDAKGTLRRIIRRPVPPDPLNRDVIERYEEAELERERRRNGEQGAARLRRMFSDETTYRKHIPLFQSAFVDGDGRLWVQRSRWPSLEGPVQWDVFVKEGFWMGSVEAPDRLRIVDSRGDLVLGVGQDERDVPFLQLHRMIPR